MDMAAQIYEYSLESMPSYVSTTCTSKIYMWTPCLGERLYLCANVGNAKVSHASFADETCQCLRLHLKDKQLYYNCRFCITP